MGNYQMSCKNARYEYFFLGMSSDICLSWCHLMNGCCKRVEYLGRHWSLLPLTAIYEYELGRWDIQCHKAQLSLSRQGDSNFLRGSRGLLRVLSPRGSLCVRNWDTRDYHNFALGVNEALKWSYENMILWHKRQALYRYLLSSIVNRRRLRL